MRVCGFASFVTRPLASSTLMFLVFTRPLAIHCLIFKAKGVLRLDTNSFPHGGRDGLTLTVDIRLMHGYPPKRTKKRMKIKRPQAGVACGLLHRDRKGMFSQSQRNKKSHRRVCLWLRTRNQINVSLMHQTHFGGPTTWAGRTDEKNVGH